MSIDVANADAEQTASLNQTESLLIARHDRFGQVLKVGQDRPALAKITHRQFANHKRMDQHLTGIERGRQRINIAINMLRPNGRIDQNHETSGRRRRPALKPGWLPPRRASLRAASR